MEASQTAVGLNVGNQYLNLNSGLHIQHIHNAFLPYLPRKLSRSGEQTECYAYSTQDNGGWKKGMSFFSNVGSSIAGTTDVNILEGDQGNTLAVVGRHFQSVALIQLNGQVVGAKTGDIIITNNLNSGSFQFIQSLANEMPPSMLDAVLLAIPVPGTTLVGTSILRNRSFAANPNINVSGGAGWNIEFADMPDGAQALWVSGGHADPTYFLLCNQSSQLTLYKRKKPEGNWNKVSGLDTLHINPFVMGKDGDGFPIRLQHAPVFVNPFDPAMIYVSCAEGVYHFVNAMGGGFFEKDIELTRLVSANKKYPLAGGFAGGNGSDVVRASQANFMCPVSSMAFDRYHPRRIVASSPFTGVFFKDGNKDWRDFSKLLPKPFTPVSSVNFSNKGIYVTTEGRGMFLIQNY